MPPWRCWLLATRPRTLGAAIAPVVLGGSLAWADDVAHLGAWAAALWGALLIQVGTNFANDYFDYVKGADTEERIGPTRATQAGWVTPGAMRRAMVLAFTLSLPAGAWLIARAGWPLAVVGVLSIASGVLYTGGPRPLGYLGLGDLFVLVFFGPVAVGGTYFVQALTLPGHVLVAGLAPGLLATALLVVNNLRDMDTDRAAGKRTLAVRFGETFARLEYTGAVVAGCGVPLWLVVNQGSHHGALLSLLTLVLAIPLLQGVWTGRRGQLLPHLGGTGRLLLVHSLLFSVGWVL